MAKRQLPDQATLLKLLRYDPETGKLYWQRRAREDGFKSTRGWATWNARYAEKEAFTSDNGKGYRNGSLLGSVEKAHRVIWKMITGRDADDIDHINGKRADNRFCNLRSVQRIDNTRNCSVYKSNKSGCPGVVWKASAGRWCARISVRGVRIHLGYFARKDDAIRVRKAAEREHGFHPNHGRVRA